MSDIIELERSLTNTVTVNGLAKIADTGEVQSFLKKIESTSVPAPISATASLTFALFYGVVKCEPRGKPYVYDEDVWGVGAAAISSIGLMYTAYDSWDAFFANTTAFHVQGIAEAGGIYQINWFNKSGTPIGQFNGAAGGIGVFEAGGSGKWKKT